MVRTNPPIDAEFKYSSPFLKKVMMSFKGEFQNDACLDIPCGNGRNTFLLASMFKNVKAIDKNQDYVNAINRNKSTYNPSGVIETLCADILTTPLTSVDQFRFICNIHFFDKTLIKCILNAMKSQAYLLIETPACHGRNFTTLPNEQEIHKLFSPYNVLMYEFNKCKNIYNIGQCGSVKILVQC